MELGIEHIIKLIDSRRTFLGISKKKLVKGICTVDMMSKIVNGQDRKLHKLEIDASQEFDRFYEELMSEIIRSLRKVEESENACEDMLSVNEFLESMHEGLFVEWTDNVPVSEAKHKIQTLYVNKLCDLLDRSEKITSSKLLVSVMQALNRIKKEGLDYSNRVAEPVAKKRAMFLVNSIIF